MTPRSGGGKSTTAATHESGEGEELEEESEEEAEGK